MAEEVDPQQGPTTSELADVMRWTLSVDLPNSKQIGRHAVGRVLTALALYCDSRGEAFPSAYALEGDVSGLSRRDVRNALVLLKEEGLIEDTGRRRGKSIVWRVGGIPRPVENTRAGGYPAHEQAGGQAGTWAGTSMGYPAQKGNGKEKPTRAQGFVTCEQHTDDTAPASHCRVCTSEVRSDPWRPEAFVGKVWFPEMRESA